MVDILKTYLKEWLRFLNPDWFFHGFFHKAWHWRVSIHPLPGKKGFEGNSVMAGVASPQNTSPLVCKPPVEPCVEGPGVLPLDEPAHGNRDSQEYQPNRLRLAGQVADQVLTSGLITWPPGYQPPSPPPLGIVQFAVGESELAEQNFELRDISCNPIWLETGCTALVQSLKNPPFVSSLKLKSQSFICHCLLHPLKTKMTMEKQKQPFEDVSHTFSY